MASELSLPDIVSLIIWARSKSPAKYHFNEFLDNPDPWDFVALGSLNELLLQRFVYPLNFYAASTETDS